MEKEKALFDFMESVHLHHLGVSNAKKIEQSWRHFEKITNDELYIDSLKHTYYDDLLKTKHLLVSDDKLRSIHDKYAKHFAFKKANPRGFTKLFEDFLRGITYFTGETDPDAPFPVYHRFASCGRIGTKESLSCRPGISRVERTIARSRVEKCYIERLIYDKLFSHEQLLFPERGNDNIVTMQDEGHKHWMNIVKEEFQKCFKDYDISVEVVWSKDTIPYVPSELILTRTKTEKGGVVIATKETYRKGIVIDNFGNKGYEALVDCTKMHKDTKYVKSQSYETGERLWKKVIYKGVMRLR